MAKGKIKISCKGATTMDIEALTFFQGNLKSLSNQNAAKLRKEILELGFSEPVGVWVRGKKNHILSGHQRVHVLKALRDDGYTVPEIPVNIINAADEKEAKRKIMALTSSYGTMQMDGLMELAAEAELDLSGIDESFTFPELAFEIKLKLNSIEGAGKTDDDAVPETNDKPVAKYGDLYQLGQHRLSCGDATRKEDVDALMVDEKAAMIFTDPPYNVDYGSSKNPRHKIRKMQNDAMTPDQRAVFCAAFFENMKACCDGDIYMWGASGPDGMRMRLQMIDMGAHWSATIIWKKPRLVLSPAKYQRMYEPCFYGWFGKSTFCSDRKQTEVWEFDRPSRSEEHPTMKPVKMCVYAIKNSSHQKDIVLDPFGGAGSTLIACEKLDRACYMMEIDPVYVDVIIRRWQEYTGEKSEKLSGSR